MLISFVISKNTRSFYGMPRSDKFCFNFCEIFSPMIWIWSQNVSDLESIATLLENEEFSGASNEWVELSVTSLYFFIAPKRLFVFAILTDMPPKTDVCASDQICLFLIKFVNFWSNLSLFVTIWYKNILSFHAKSIIEGFWIVTS